ncbi:MAG TPA: class I SAM-dependent methyltransferase [Hyphomicrobiaceae bacterium]|nr:class I SAM-dependent methyltransferase [Hyphomicrobiaceae bacterium]
MADTIGMAAQAAGQAVRFGFYLGLNRIVDWRTGAFGRAATEKPRGPMPSQAELLRDLVSVLMQDAAAVRDGVYPPISDEPSLPVQLKRIRDMLADLPSTLARRHARDASTAEAVPRDDLPDYFVQDFHFQTGGYLTEESAALYDLQVETLFYGAAGAMRRQALRPISAFMHGRDQRQMRLLDLACGTGRFLRAARLAYPAMKLSGLDLSTPYLDEARRHLKGLRSVDWIAANAEAIPLADASQDIVTTVFLFHELPPEVRRRVAREMSRVLKPGGLLVFIDSLQMGDRPGWDGLLEAFPARFHEPYYRHYAIDDLDGVFNDAGLVAVEQSAVFLAKMMVRRKAA